MNKKGFTLVELLGVVLIIALLTILVFPNITGTVKESKQKTDDVTLKLIYGASELYIKNHPDLFPIGEGNKYIISLEDLVDDMLLVSPITFSNDSHDLTHSMSVQVTYDGNYSYELKHNSECEYKLYGYSFSDVNDNNKMDLGDKFELDRDKFYVLYSTAESIVLLSELAIFNGETPTQVNLNASQLGFSSTDYWSNYPEYVYNSNSALHDIVERYKQYLISEGLKVDAARLINNEDLKYIDCILSGSGGLCISTPDFIKSMNYWTGISSSQNNIYQITSTGINSIDAQQTSFLRPVIVINK